MNERSLAKEIDEQEAHNKDVRADEAKEILGELSAERVRRKQERKGDGQYPLPTAMPEDGGKKCLGVDPMANSETGAQKYEQWQHERKMAPLIDARRNERREDLESEGPQRRESLPDRLRREAKDMAQEPSNGLATRKPEQDLDRLRSR